MSFISRSLQPVEGDGEEHYHPETHDGQSHEKYVSHNDSSGQAQHAEQQVDKLDADERCDDSPDAVDQEVAPQ